VSLPECEERMVTDVHYSFSEHYSVYLQKKIIVKYAGLVINSD